MVAEFGRVTDVAYEAVDTTALHARRIVGAVSSALVRVTREVEDLVWDFQDMAGDLRRSAAGANDLSAVVVDIRKHAQGRAGRLQRT